MKYGWTSEWKVKQVSPSRKLGNAQDDCLGGPIHTGMAGRVPAPGRGGLLSCLLSSVQWDTSFFPAILSAALSHLTQAVYLVFSRYSCSSHISFSSAGSNGEDVLRTDIKSGGKLWTTEIFAVLWMKNGRDS